MVSAEYGLEAERQSDISHIYRLLSRGDLNDHIAFIIELGEGLFLIDVAAEFHSYRGAGSKVIGGLLFEILLAVARRKNKAERDHEDEGKYYGDLNKIAFHNTHLPLIFRSDVQGRIEVDIVYLLVSGRILYVLTYLVYVDVGALIELFKSGINYRFVALYRAVVIG